MVAERGIGRSGKFAIRNQFEIRGRSKRETKCTSVTCESWSFAYIGTMGLSCLLLTSDATLLKVIRSGFSAASVDLELRTDAAGAIELSSRRHLDGFVLDCDDAFEARDVLAKIRSSRSNQLSLIFVVVNATTTIAIKAMADFVLTKPVYGKDLSRFEPR